MFEQSIYEPEIVAPPQQADDFLYNYEINTWWKPSPTFYKILGLSAIGNILVIVLVAQTSLLTMKGCDSPLVGNVCQVLDTLYVGSMLLSNDRAYVDAQYDKTTIGDNDDVTFVDVTGETPPLSYPDGYFQLANPDQFAMNDQAMVVDQGLNNGTFPNSPSVPITPPTTNGGSILDTPPVLPDPNKATVTGTLPTFDNPPVRAPRGSRAKVIQRAKPDEDDTATAKPKASPTPAASPLPTAMTSDAVAAVQINKRPLSDFADDVAAKVVAKEVDLSQPFSVGMTASITPDGKLDRINSKFDLTKTKGDPKMIDVAKHAMEALGDSGILGYLKLAGVDQITTYLSQDDKQLTVTITSMQKTPERANTVSGMVSAALLYGKMKYTDPAVDERTLLDGANVTTDGKTFVLNFALPKDKAQEMINRKLAEAAARKAQQQPSGNTNSKTTNDLAQH